MRKAFTLRKVWYARGTGILAFGLLFLFGCWRMPASLPTDEAIEAYGRLGMAAYRKGNYARAEEEWQKGLRIAREAGRTVDEARFLVRLSRTSEGTGDYDTALKRAETAIEVLGDKGDPVLAGQALLQKGLAYRRKALYESARPLFDRALAMARRLQIPRLEAESLRHIASLLQDQGRLDAALPYYRQALALAREEGCGMCEARSLNNLGLLFDAKADYAKALEKHRASLTLRRKIGDRAGEGKVLGNICITYTKLNQYERALETCREALHFAEDIEDRQRTANHLNNIGSLYRKMEKPRKALRYYRRSLKIKRKLSDPAGEARALNNIGETYWILGELDRAEEYLTQSLEIKADIEDLAGQSASLQNMALLYRRRGQYSKAKSYYLKAVSFNILAGQPELTWRAFDGLSYVYESLSRNDLAILFGKQALRSIQETRDRMASLNDSLRRSYLNDKSRVYKHVADLLIRQGRLPEAQQVISLLKEEEYLHYLDTRRGEENTVGDVARTTSESAWLNELSAFEGEMGKIAHDFRWLTSEKRHSELSEEEKEKKYLLYDRVDEIQAAFESFLGKIEEEFEVRSEEKKQPDLKRLESILADLSEYEPTTVILIYLVLPDGLSILIVTPELSFARGVSIPEEELNEEVYNLKGKLNKPGLDPLPQAKRLYNLLISPVEKDLNHLKAKNLMISLDGTLRYIPMAALFDGNQYLTQKYSLVLYNLAARNMPEKDESEPLRAVGLGASEAVGGFPALTSVPEELDAIIKEADEGDVRGVLPGEVFLNRDFTKNKLTEILEKKDPITMKKKYYPIVHIASHFSYQREKKKSFLLLGNGDPLTMEDLKSVRYPLKGLELLVLSACETAVEGRDALGREIESLATFAEIHGAKAILATLWSVADTSTAKFMAFFYSLRSQKGLSKVEALRQAQLMFLHGNQEMEMEGRTNRGVAVVDDGGGFTPPPDAPYAHPFYWAPFILFGNFL